MEDISVLNMFWHTNYYYHTLLLLCCQKYVLKTLFLALDVMLFKRFIWKFMGLLLGVLFIIFTWGLLKTNLK